MNKQEEFTTDAPIFVVDEQGNRTPCEDNEYVLQNGQTIVVKSGKISEIKEETVVENGGETPVEDANVEELKEEQMEIVVEDIEKIEEVEANPLEEKVKKIEEDMAKVLEMISGLVNNSEEMSQKFEEFSKQPAEDAIGTNRVTFSENMTQEQIRTERLKQLKNSLK